MSTSVKLTEADKQRLEKLQALVTLKAGGKMTQQELLALLIREAWARGPEFVTKLVKPPVPLGDAEYERIRSLVEDWGVPTRWEDIDKTLYGARARRRA